MNSIFTESIPELVQIIFCCDGDVSTSPPFGEITRNTFGAEFNIVNTLLLSSLGIESIASKTLTLQFVDGILGIGLQL